MLLKLTPIKSSIHNDTFIQLTLTSPKRVVRKVISSKGVSYQLALRKGAQEFHENFSEKAFLKWLEGIDLKDAILFTTEADYYYNSKGGVKKKSPSMKDKALAHNRKKLHLVDEAPYFEKLKIGRDKKLQIEKFLQEVKAILPAFDGKKRLKVADFGCGKAYLTFALYDFLSRDFEVEMIGIDLKEQVMEDCQRLAEELGYGGLKFLTGRIEEMPGDTVDLAVALHACNTATDSAIARAVQMQAKVILAAPCCQHELLGQVKSEVLGALMKHGVLKERFSALLTDAVRGALLEKVGYRVNIVEFIDAAHTPKNVLIRAVYTGRKRVDKYQNLKQAFSIEPTLEKLLLSKSFP